jgi:hypothetical protein
MARDVNTGGLVIFDPPQRHVLAGAIAGAAPTWISDTGRNCTA